MWYIIITERERKEKKMTKIFAIVGWILMGLLGIFLIWFGISFIDVVIHNTNLDGGTILSTWNLFEIIL